MTQRKQLYAESQARSALPSTLALCRVKAPSVGTIGALDKIMSMRRCATDGVLEFRQKLSLLLSHYVWF
jgi:hypothetical protein